MELIGDSVAVDEAEREKRIFYKIQSPK